MARAGCFVRRWWIAAKANPVAVESVLGGRDTARTVSLPVVRREDAQALCRQGAAGASSESPPWWRRVLFVHRRLQATYGSVLSLVPAEPVPDLDARTYACLKRRSAV